MRFDIGAIFAQLVSMYARLPLAQKVAIPLLIAGSVFALVFVSRWANQPDYQVLFSGLKDSDAAGVVEYLKDKKVGYQLRDNGATVEITPPSRVNELRLELAASGLPKGGNVGFEVFKENNLGRTGFVEKMLGIQALQGELERTIQSIDAVRSVRVHITKPDRSVFATKDVLPTASVLLNLKAGAELTQHQIKGIANLVSNAIERLTPENVTIVDTQGNLLNEKREAEEIAGADITRLDYQRKLEGAYEKRIETMLSEILGPGKSVARVTTDLNFNKFEREEEVYDPAGRVARSERSIAEQANLGAEGGVPGVMANLTNQPGILTPPEGGRNGNVRSESVTNYEVSRSVSRTSTQLGKLNRLSVAVLVDGQYAGTGEAEANKEYHPLATETMRQIENLVKQAVGFDATRGDIVTVENIRFNVPDKTLEKMIDETTNNQIVAVGTSYVIPFLLAVIFLFVVVRPML